MSAIRAALTTTVVAAAAAGALAAPASAAVTTAGPAAPASAADTTAWAQPGHGPARTYYQPNEPVINASTVADLGVSWTRTSPEADGWSCSGPSEPVVAGGRVFVTDQRGIAAYLASSGRLLWRYTARFPEDESTARMAVVGGLLVAGVTGCQSQSDPNGTLFALNVTTGRQAWRVDARGPVASLVADRGLALVAGSSESSAPAVRAFRVTDGKLRWRAAGHGTTGVAAAGRLLTRRGGTVAALAVDTGRLLWSRAGAADGVAATPAGDRFLVRDGRGVLFSLTAATGALVWKAAGYAGRLATDGRRIYLGLGDALAALDARTGKRLWLTGTDGWDPGQPVRAGGLVYAMVDRDKLRVWNAATGRLAHNGGEPGSHGALAVSGGRVFLADTEGIMAFTPK